MAWYELSALSSSSKYWTYVHCQPVTLWLSLLGALLSLLMSGRPAWPRKVSLTPVQPNLCTEARRSPKYRLKTSMEPVWVISGCQRLQGLCTISSQASLLRPGMLFMLRPRANPHLDRSGSGTTCVRYSLPVAAHQSLTFTTFYRAPLLRCCLLMAFLHLLHS